MAVPSLRTPQTVPKKPLVLIPSLTVILHQKTSPPDPPPHHHRRRTSSTPTDPHPPKHRQRATHSSLYKIFPRRPFRPPLRLHTLRYLLDKGRNARITPTNGKRNVTGSQH